MRELIDGADYLATEIGVVLHLCEHIDRQADDELSAAIPTLHAVMHNRLDDLADVIGRMAAAVPAIADEACASVREP